MLDTDDDEIDDDTDEVDDADEVDDDDSEDDTEDADDDEDATEDDAEEEPGGVSLPPPQPYKFMLAANSIIAFAPVVRE